jgi:SAM-dependent methyltransferase
LSSHPASAATRSGIAELEQTWNQLAEDDPLWAILSDPAKKGNRWALDQFLASGREEIDGVLAHLDELQVEVARGAALDFGCGVGRLSQALALHFGQVTGVDISHRMVEQAERLNRHGDRVRYRVNVDDSLRQLEDATVDFVYSSMVLQHLPPPLALRYVAEFLRVVRPGGVVVFQAIHPTRRFDPRVVAKNLARGRLLDLYRRLRYRSRQRFELWGLSKRRLERVIQTGGGRIVEVWSPGRGQAYSSFRYMVVRDGSSAASTREDTASRV